MTLLYLMNDVARFSRGRAQRDRHGDWIAGAALLGRLTAPRTHEEESIMPNRYPFCQVGGCHRRAARAVELDLPAAWEASATFTTLSVVAGLCCEHGHDVSHRVQAMLQARLEFHDLLSIIEQAIRYEKAQQLKLEAATDQSDRFELENGGLRRELLEREAELRLQRADQRQLSVAGAGI